MPLRASIESLTIRETTEASEILARAFQDNPLNRGVIDTLDPARRLRANRRGMNSLLPVACAHGVVLGARVEGALSGVLIATPPDAYPLPAPSPGPRLWTWLLQGPRVTGRWNEVFRALHALHPLEPHAYLGTLGVAPCDQRQGVGSALLAHWLGTADADGVPAYLETDRQENLAFYGRAGFEVAQETHVFGARVWCLWRPARGTPSD